MKKVKKIASLACAFLLACSACPVNVLACPDLLPETQKEIVIDGITYSSHTDLCVSTLYRATVDGIDYMASVNSDGEVMYNIAVPDTIFNEVSGLTYSFVGYRGHNMIRYEAINPDNNITYVGEIWLPAMDDSTIFYFKWFVLADGITYYQYQSEYRVYAIDKDVTFTSGFLSEIDGIPVDIDNISADYDTLPLLSQLGCNVYDNVNNITVDGLTYFPHVVDGELIGYDLVGVEIQDASVTTISVPTEINGLPVLFYEDAINYRMLTSSDITPHVNGTVTFEGLVYQPKICFDRINHKVDVSGYVLLGAEDTSVTSVTIPSEIYGVGVIDVVDNPFYNCDSLTEIFAEKSSHNYLQSINGVLYWGYQLISYPNAKPDTEFTIAETKIGIGKDAFYNCPNLETLIAPKSMDYADKNAFVNCPALTTVYRYTNDEDIEEFIQVCEENNIAFVALDADTATLEDEIEIPAVKGDATGDGEVDILDIITANKAILGQKTLTPEQTQALDIDGNGIVDTTDSLAIMKYITGLTESL